MKTFKPVIKIYTPYGKVYEVDSDGKINGSDNWIMLGLASVKSNYFIPFKDLTEERIKSIQLTYKNGNPIFTVRDKDHGTTREWGNTTVHGVKHITFN